MSKQLFLLGCIPARIVLAYIAFYFSHKAENRQMNILLSMIALVISAGFFYIYFTGSRKTGLETGGKPIWWNNWRPVHGTIYLLFAVLTLSGVKNAWLLLALDVIIGLTSFGKHYYLDSK